MLPNNSTPRFIIQNNSYTCAPENMFKIFIAGMFIKVKYWEKFKTLPVIKQINCGKFYE